MKYDPFGNAIHGFVLQEEWKITQKGDNQLYCTFTQDSSKFGPLGFPSTLHYELTYTLEEQGGLRVDSIVTNQDSQNAPFALGFHPFFCIETSPQIVDEFTLSIPAKELIEFDEKLIPTGKRIPMEEAKQYQFTDTTSPIGNVVIDNCYTKCVRDSQGIATTILSHVKSPQKKVMVWQDEAFDYIQVYSFDKMESKNKRRGIAIEPESACGFAANFDNLGLRVLKPNEQFKGSWGVRYENLL